MYDDVTGIDLDENMLRLLGSLPQVRGCVCPPHPPTLENVFMSSTLYMYMHGDEK